MRSPMAEYFFNHYNKNENWIAKSAGTSMHGGFIESITETMKEKNIDLTEHRSKQIDDELINEADIIIALAPESTRYLPEIKTRQKFFRDPYYEGASSLPKIRDEIEKYVKELVEELN